MSVLSKAAIGAGLVLCLVSSAQARWVHEGLIDALSACAFAVGTGTAQEFAACMSGKGYAAPDNPTQVTQYEWRHTGVAWDQCTYRTLQSHPKASPTVNPWTLHRSGEEIDPDFWRWMSLCMSGMGYMWVSDEE